jgi:hypothetical protein
VRSLVCSRASRLCVAACAAALAVACTREHRDADSTTDRTPGSPASDRGAADWIASPRGVGPLRIGMTRAEAEAVVGGSLAIPNDSAWADCAYTPTDRLPSGVHVMVEQGTIARIDVDSGAIATAEGARIHDSEDRIRQLYGSRVVTAPAKYANGHSLTVKSGAGADTLFRVVFESDSGRVRSYRVGRVPAVEYAERCG